MNKPLKQQVLERARQLLSVKSHWNKMSFARDKDGRSCSPHDKEAVCFCAWGALIRAEGEFVSKREASRYTEVPGIVELQACVGTEHIPSWNDSPDISHEDVLAAFDCAIAKAGAP